MSRADPSKGECNPSDGDERFLDHAGPSCV
jgi:hypothetical protein